MEEKVETICTEIRKLVSAVLYNFRFGKFLIYYFLEVVEEGVLEEYHPFHRSIILKRRRVKRYLKLTL